MGGQGAPCPVRGRNKIEATPILLSVVELSTAWPYYRYMIKTKESAAADRALRNARGEAEEALYNAWMAYYGMEFISDLTEEEEAGIHAACRETYEKAYELLGPEWTQSTIRAARKDSGEDE